MTNFEKWVTKMNTYFGKDYLNGDCDVEWLFDGKVTICYDITNNKIGIAKCHPDDENDFHIGKAIAYARCKGYNVPKQKVYKKPSKMRYGNKFLCYGTVYTFVGKDPTDETFFIGVSVSKYGERNFVRFNNREYEMVD